MTDPIQSPLRAILVDCAAHPFHVRVDDVQDLEVLGMDHEHVAERDARDCFRDECLHGAEVTKRGRCEHLRQAPIFSQGVRERIAGVAARAGRVERPVLCCNTR